LIHALDDVLRGAARWRHSENIAERSMRYFNNRVESGFVVVQRNWTKSLFLFGIVIVLLFLVFRSILRDDPNYIYVPQHRSRLD
jgi:sugar phosphate permease